MLSWKLLYVAGADGDPRPVQGPERWQDPDEAAGDYLWREPWQAQQGHPASPEGREHQQMPNLPPHKGKLGLPTTSHHTTTHITTQHNTTQHHTTSSQKTDIERASTDL